MATDGLTAAYVPDPDPRDALMSLALHAGLTMSFDSATMRMTMSGDPSLVAAWSSLHRALDAATKGDTNG